MSNVLNFVRTVAALAVGLFVAFVLVVGVELLSNVLHPLPSSYRMCMGSTTRKAKK